MIFVTLNIYAHTYKATEIYITLDQIIRGIRSVTFKIIVLICKNAYVYKKGTSLAIFFCSFISLANEK